MNNFFKVSTLLAFFCFVFSTHSFAQKGNILAYGSLDFTKTNTSGSSFSTFPGGGIPVGVGYFINNNTLLGVNYAFDREYNSNKKLNFSQNETGFWYSPSKQIGKYFLLIAQVDAHYVWGKMNTNAAFPDQLNNFQGFRLRAYPMLAILLGKGWALKFKFGELSYLSRTPKGGNAQTVFVAGMSGNTFGTGISKTFSLKRKPKPVSDDE